MSTQIESGVPVRTNADGNDEKLHAKIVGHATNPAVGQVAEFQQLIDSAGNAHALSHGRDAGGTTHPILTDASGRVFIVPADEAVGIDVHDPHQAADVVRNATSTHTYTVPALKTLKLKQIIVMASGACHAEILAGDDGSEVSYGWLFLRGGGAKEEIVFARTLDLTAAQVVKIVKKNVDQQTQDLHSLVIGHLE